eukprot:a685393_25.p1 GENE.a685393_25~~a685393_25.p1  ORF type:complete len:148 (+),score=48.95 a685393_25:32-445(+)
MAAEPDAKRQRTVDGGTHVTAARPAPKTAAEPVIQYFCISCGKHTMDVTQSIEKEQKRRSEPSFAVPTAAIALFDLDFMGPVRIRRKAGLEQQFRFRCKGCGVFIAYRTFPPEREHDNVFTYVVEDRVKRNATDTRP